MHHNIGGLYNYERKIFSLLIRDAAALSAGLGDFPDGASRSMMRAKSICPYYDDGGLRAIRFTCTDCLII